MGTKSDFEKIRSECLLELIHETQAKGNTKYRIEDILTDFGNDILTLIEKRMEKAIYDIRFNQF